MTSKKTGMDSRESHFDVIVIGSGIGGLATASLLSQVGGKRVLVVEKHFKLGGFTHSFRRRQYEWDAGVHYVGEMQEGAMARRVMDLVTRKGVQWHRMGETLERVMLPEGSFEIPSDPKQFKVRLIERFPDDAVEIADYFRDLKRAQGWMARWYVSKQLPLFLAGPITWLGKKLVSMTTEEYLERFRSPLLRSILAAQWPDYGTPPSESSFGIHATVAADFLNGGYFPIGGSKQIAIHVSRVIEQHGGRCLVNHEVKSINLVNGKATGVTVEHKGKVRVYTAPIIVSNAGARATFNRMLPESVGRKERLKLTKLKDGTSALVLFLGLKDDPRKFGFDDANYWLYDRMKHQLPGIERVDDRDEILGAFVSFGSLRNPGQDAHTAQVITFGGKGDWLSFADKPWMKRGEQYEARKEELGKAMLEFADKHLPGLAGIVDYQELSTPLTVESFTGHAGGIVYGQACDAKRLFEHQWRVATSVRNLYLTGSDVGTPGVNGALMAGVMTAARILGPFGLPRVMSRVSGPT